jgi:hypothetical protein
MSYIRTRPYIFSFHYSLDLDYFSWRALCLSQHDMYFDVFSRYRNCYHRFSQSENGDLSPKLAKYPSSAKRVAAMTRGPWLRVNASVCVC